MNPHWELFPEFVKQELAAGGPDPQIALIQELGKDCTIPQDMVWLAGCYCACHCIPTAWVTWNHFGAGPAFFDSSGGRLEKWLRDNWTFLPVRPEMRSHRMPEKRAKCLHDFAQYALEWTISKSELSYEELWEDSIRKIKFYNRYMAIKFLEILRRTVAPGLEMPDMRAKGSWSPRKTLALLWPEETILGVREDESKAALEMTDLRAEDTQLQLATRGIDVNLFQLQVLLCEYKEALAGGFYPGGTHDEELAYIRTVEKGFPDLMAPIFEARKKLFPHEFLGELNGWDGLRPEKFQVFKGAGK